MTLIFWNPPLPSTGSQGLIANTLVANLPQVIHKCLLKMKIHMLTSADQLVLSFLYFLFNGICTCMLLAKEWSEYAYKRKTLRVSLPIEGQRSTYFLQLPYKYAIPLLIFSGALHWFVSQSIFLANINEYGVHGLSSEDSYSTCGYSPIAMIFVIILGSLLILLELALGFRTYKPGIPLAGSCSKKISAACHIPENELELHPEQGPLQWGVVPGVFDKNGNPHCSFSSKSVINPLSDGFDL